MVCRQILLTCPNGYDNLVSDSRYWSVELMEIDRSRLSKCLAKAIAYQQVDKPEDAEEWARELIRELHLANILK